MIKNLFDAQRLQPALTLFAMTMALLPEAANADIILTMKKWSAVPRVVIAEGLPGDCKSAKIIYDGIIYAGYREIFPGTGSDGHDICYRRTIEPKDPGSLLGVTWTRCPDGECEIQ